MLAKVAISLILAGLLVLPLPPFAYGKRNQIAEMIVCSVFPGNTSTLPEIAAETDRRRLSEDVQVAPRVRWTNQRTPTPSVPQQRRRPGPQQLDVTRLLAAVWRQTLSALCCPGLSSRAKVHLRGLRQVMIAHDQSNNWPFFATAHLTCQAKVVIDQARFHFAATETANHVVRGTLSKKNVTHPHSAPP